MSEAQSTDQQLKPCPFCGVQPAFDSTDDGGEWVFCPGCMTSSCIRFPLKEGVRDHLIEAWNRRTTTEIERLRTAMIQACSDMGCYCADDDPLPDNLKCPMCKLEKALHG